MSVRIYVRDSSLHRIGQIDDFQSLGIKKLFNSAGRWNLDLDISTSGAAMLSESTGITIEYAADGINYKPSVSGSVDDLHRTYSDGSNRLLVSGPDDNVWLSRRFAGTSVPSKLNDGTMRFGNYNTTYSGPAETVIKQIVTDNCSSTALDPAMVVPHLIVAPDQGRGPFISYPVRFEPLNELISTLALLGNDMAWEIKQVGQNLVFDVYPQEDVSGYARFGLELHNLASYDYERKAPVANYILVAGGNDPTKGQQFDGAQLASGSTLVNFPGAPTFDDTDVNALIVGSGVPTGATVEQVINPTQIRMDQAATSDSTSQQLTVGGSEGETYTGGVLNVGSPLLTFPYADSFNSGMIGETVKGENIPDGTTVSDYSSPTQIILSQNPSGSASSVELHIGGVAGTDYDGGQLTNGSDVLTFPNDALFVSGDAGSTARGTGIPSSTTIATYVDPTHATLSNPATQTITSMKLSLSGTPPEQYSGAFLVNGSNVVTFLHANSFNSGLVGKAVTGTGLAGGSIISSYVSSQEIALNLAALSDHGSSTLTVDAQNGAAYFDCITAAGNRTITKRLATHSAQLFPSGVAGQLVRGPGIPEGTTVSSWISGDQIVLSNAPQFNNPSTTFLIGGSAGFSFSGAFVQAGSTTITIPPRPGFNSGYIGATITGSGIPSGSTITGINSSNEVVISNNVTKNGGSVTVTVQTGTAPKVFEGASITTGSVNISVPSRPSFDGSFIGQSVAGTSIPPDTTISSIISTNSVHMSHPARANRQSIKVTVNASSGTLIHGASFTSDSPTVVIPVRPSFNGSHVGLSVKGVGVPSGTVIQAILATNEAQMSANALKNVARGTYTIGAIPGTTFTGASLEAGSPTVSFPNSPAFDNTYINKLITGSDLPAGTYIQNVTGPTSLTLTQAAAKDVVSEALRVGDEQIFVAVFDPDSIAIWGTITGKLVDQTASIDINTLTQAGLNQLAKDADQLALACTTMDTVGISYSNEWGMNSVVGVVIDGVTIKEAVREIDLTWASADSPVEVKPVIGSADATHPQVPRLFKRLRNLATRLEYKERTAG